MSAIQPQTNHSFIQQLHTQRDQKQYSLRTIAKLTGFSHPYLSRVFRGHYVMSLETGLSLCSVLEIDIALCIEYIYEIEHNRLIQNIHQACGEWQSFLPDNALDALPKQTYQVTTSA